MIYHQKWVEKIIEISYSYGSSKPEIDNFKSKHIELCTQIITIKTVGELIVSICSLILFILLWNVLSTNHIKNIFFCFFIFFFFISSLLSVSKINEKFIYFMNIFVAEIKKIKVKYLILYCNVSMQREKNTKQNKSYIH